MDGSRRKKVRYVGLAGTGEFILTGNQYDYPIEIKHPESSDSGFMVYKYTTIDGQDEFILFIDDYMKRTGHKLKQILEDCMIDDTVNLIDERAMDIYEHYQFYKYAPHLIDNYPWFRSVNILNQIFMRVL